MICFVSSYCFCLLVSLFLLLWMLVQFLPLTLTRACLWCFKGSLITARYRNPKSGRREGNGTETGEDETTYIGVAPASALLIKICLMDASYWPQFLRLFIITGIFQFPNWRIPFSLSCNNINDFKKFEDIDASLCIYRCTYLWTCIKCVYVGRYMYTDVQCMQMNYKWVMPT